MIGEDWVTEKLLDNLQGITPNEVYRESCLVAGKIYFGGLPLCKTGQCIDPV
jgi:hypothetical protein